MARAGYLPRLLLAALPMAAGGAAVAALASDGPAVLVRDIRTQPSAYASSYPSRFVAVGDAVYFTASPVNLNGRELWRTDGTPSGTVRVADLVPEEVFEFRPDHLTAFGGAIVFTVGRYDSGVELWTSDGTETGTRLLKDLRHGSASSDPADLVAAGDLLFFTADDGDSGRELWRSDGTEHGIVRVADLTPGPNGSQVQALTRVGERVYFTAFREGQGRELWVSDGTEVGTMRIEAPAGLPSPALPGGLTAVGDTLYFAAEDPEAGRELWRVDTTGRAVRVSDVNPGPEGSRPGWFVDRDGQLCFLAFHPASLDLWCSDGTPEGTAGIDTGAVQPAHLTASAGLLYFSAREESPRTEVHPGRDLWRSDGTPGGTFRVGTLHTDVPGGPSISLFDFGGTLIYAVSGGLYPGGAGLGRSDGTAAGTMAIHFTGVTSLTVTATALYFASSDGEHGVEPWRSDGTAAGTTLLRDIVAGADASPGELTALGDAVLFTARGDDGLRRLWRSDGTELGTVPVASADASEVGGVLAASSFAFFTAATSANGRELWRTDGTDAALVRDIRPGPAPSDIAYLASLGDLALFQADDGPAGAEPWRSDGTAAGTFMLRDIDPAGDSQPLGFAAFGAHAYFAAGGELGHELWRTDGSAAGTVLVKDINPGPPSSIPVRLVAAGPLLFMRATEGLGDTELWRTDGTEAGTVRVRDINPGAGPSFPSGLTPLLRAVVDFAADDGSHGVEPWRSDGTEAGTFLLGDLLAGPGSSITAFSEPEIRFAAAGHQAFFIADDGVHGRELWRTDGTEAGTRLVRDVFAGAAPAFAAHLTGSQTAVGPLLLFAAFEPNGGNELWRSDGSETGTRRLQDIATGPLSASPYGFAAAGAAVFFGASDGVHGTELWTVPRAAFNTACAGDCDEDGSVVVSELLVGVTLLLERADPARCIAADRDLDGYVAVAELITAVNRALDGCAS